MEFIYHHRTAGRGGEGLHITSLIRALQAAGHSVILISPPGVDPLQTAGCVPLDKGVAHFTGIQRVWKWISCRCPQILFEIFELGYNLYAPLRLVPALRRHRSAVFYERYAFFLFVGVVLAKWCGHRVMLEVNEVAGVQRARGQALVPLARWLERIVFRRADHIVTVSSFLKQEILRRGTRERAVHVLPNAIEPKRFEVNGSGEAIRRQLRFGAATVVGFVGWFDRWDRLDLLVDAIRDLQPAHPDLRLMLVGDGPVSTSLKAKIEREHLQETVILTGPVARDDVPHYIAAMDICVLPDSNSFGSPIVLFEFMALARAVIAPDLPPIRDVLKNRETGLIIERNNLTSLRTAISTLVEDIPFRHELGWRASRDVLENHTWAANARRVVELVAEVSQAGAGEKR